MSGILLLLGFTLMLPAMLTAGLLIEQRLRKH